MKREHEVSVTSSPDCNPTMPASSKLAHLLSFRKANSGCFQQELLKDSLAYKQHHLSGKASIVAEISLEVISPGELKGDPVGGFVAAVLALIALDLVVDGPGGQAAMREPGREFGGVVRAEHAIAGVEVAGHRTRVPGVVLQPPQCLLLASLEGVRRLRSTGTNK